MVGIVGHGLGLKRPGSPESARDAHVVTARIVFDTMYTCTAAMFSVYKDILYLPTGLCSCLGGPRGAVRLCVGGCRETKNARPARAVAALRSRLVPPATSVGDPLFCAPHSPAHFAGVQLVRQGLGAGCERGAERALRRWRWTTAAQRRVCVRSPGSGVSGERRAPGASGERFA